MIGQDGTYYHLNVSTSGNNISGSFHRLSQLAGSANAVGSTAGLISGVVAAPGVRATLTIQGGDADTLLLNFDNIYNLGSSLPTLAGAWSHSSDGFSLTATIQADGTFTAIDSNNCSYSGAFSLIDSNRNAYGENYIRSCNGTDVTFTGLASYFPATGSASPADIKILADDGAAEYLSADLQ